MGMVVQDILARKETLLKPNDMTNEEKTMLLLEEVCNDEFGEVIPDKNWTPCNLTCRQVRKKIEYTCINIAQWKDEQIKQFKNYADEMFEAARNLSTDASRLRKAMQEYKQFRDDYNYEHNTTKTD